MSQKKVTVDLTTRELSLLFQVMETQAIMAVENKDPALEKEWTQMIWKFSSYLPMPSEMDTFVSRGNGG